MLAIAAIHYLVRNYEQNQLAEDSQKLIELSQNRFKDLERQDIAAIKTTLNTLVENPAIKEIYLSGDKEGLFEYNENLFNKNRELYGITHWYFISPEGKTFLRMHNPEIDNDTIDRITFREAQRTQEIAAGIELGKTAYALRVVSPYYNQSGELIGYVELAQEIDHFLTELSSDTEAKYAIATQKEYLDQEKWASVREVAGLSNNWDDHKNYVFTNSNIGEGSVEDEALAPYLIGEHFRHTEMTDSPYIHGNEEIGDKNFTIGSFPLFDASNVNVGEVFGVIDTTKVMHAVDREIQLATIIALASGFLFFVVVWLFLKIIIINPLDNFQRAFSELVSSNYKTKLGIRSKDELGDLARNFDEMVDQIKESRSEVDRKVAEQTKDIEEQKARLEKQQRSTMNILEDVEQEKIKAEELSKELEKFKLAVENTSDYIVITDNDGNVIYSNGATEKTTGFSAKEVIGKKIGTKKLWGGQMDGKFYKKLWQTIKEKKKDFNGEFENKKKTGEKFVASSSISPITDEKGNVLFFVNVGRDVTKEKEVEQAKSEFVSLASHQLRTPATGVKQFLGMILEGYAGKFSKEQEGLLKDAYESNERQIQIVHDLLETARADAGTMKIEYGKADLAKITEEIITELKSEYEAREQKVIFKKPKKNVQIDADPHKLHMVIDNLVGNAIKYTPEKGKVEVTLSYPGKSAKLTVKDNGIGIPKKEIKRLFTKFHRVKNDYTDEAGGTGLGLYMAKKIIDLHGGEIKVESKEGKGTEFTVIMPKKGK